MSHDVGVIRRQIDPMAKPPKFDKREYFEADEASREVPKVQF